MNDRINVTKPFLPPIEEYQAYVQEIWKTGHLTNQGPLLKRLEAELEEYLGVSNFHFVSNGTLALQIAIRALDITEGEIITTPFSYVATTSSILWEKCKPVFVDIEPETFCIDPGKIEAAITDQTKAIMAVHVFGNPCAVEEIERIAEKHSLKVIYDAAHAFGVTYKGESLLSRGDISICSFHATKLFHTIEGGGLVVGDKDVSEVVELTKRFGHHGDDHYMLGMNAKADEFQAAMGLCNMKYIDRIIAGRKAAHETYDKLLSNDKFKKPIVGPDTSYNYAYYPVVLGSQAQLLSAMEKLAQENIHPRRYFYPSLNKLPYIEDDQSCPVSEDIASRVMCLPMYTGLETKDIERICAILGEV